MYTLVALIDLLFETARTRDLLLVTFGGLLSGTFDGLLMNGPFCGYTFRVCEEEVLATARDLEVEDFKFCLCTLDVPEVLFTKGPF